MIISKWSFVIGLNPSTPLIIGDSPRNFGPNWFKNEGTAPKYIKMIYSMMAPISNTKMCTSILMLI